MGFCRFDELGQVEVRLQDGVYVVVRPSLEPPTFLPSSRAGRFKGREPSVSVPDLEAVWVEGTTVLYVGKAAVGAQGRRGLRKRLDEYRRHGQGAPVGHWGGRYIWQLADRDQLLVAWKPTPRVNPEQVETELIDDFRAQYGVSLPLVGLEGVGHLSARALGQSE